MSLKHGRIGVADRAGGPADLSQSPLSQPRALIPCAARFLLVKRGLYYRP
jgi:hypothetical protein